ncbi:MAG: hypothetical protein ACI9EF_001104 [Pseudohongiellaceae bacterium]
MNPLILLCCLVFAQVEQPAAAHDEGADASEALVARIQENLGLIDETLFSTLDAQDPGSVLESVRQTHMDVIRDLEELINQAKYQSSGKGGGGGGSPSDPPPQSQESGEGDTPRESDGDQAPESGEGEAPQPPSGKEGEQEGGQDEPQPQGENGDGKDPGDQLDDSDPASNRMGGPPPEEERDNPVRENTDARWGLLPPKLQERLMNLHVDDVPSRYRDWLSAYIRAMQRLEEADGR